MLMTKFGKGDKTGCSSFLFRIVRFWHIQVKTKGVAKLEDLKIQCVLRHGKGLRSIKEARWNKFKPKAKGTKTGWSVFGFQRARFSQNRYNLINVWDLVCLEKIFPCTSQRAMSCCLYKHKSRPIDVFSIIE
jgi:hypothetical protein